MFGIDDMLIRVARAVLEGVLSQLAKQLSVVEDQALAPMRAMIEAVTGGIWVGDGADAFVAEVASIMIPGVGQVSSHISTISNNLKFARDVIDRADEEINRMVSSRLLEACSFY